MSNLELWIDKGTFCQRPTRPDGGVISDRKLLHDYSLVKLETGSNGTHVSWVMFGANWASLYFLREFIVTCVAPITLHYFNAGWFEETIDSSVDAASRIDTLILKSDVRFSERVYLKALRPSVGEIPEDLRSIIEAGEIPDGQSIVCAVDPALGTSKVEHIGEETLLGKVWGRAPISYPALSGHSYDRIVSQPYFDVLKSGRMHYDQVLASMIMPNGEQKWFGYHRVIVPDVSPAHGAARVKVACALAPVEIKLL